MYSVHGKSCISIVTTWWPAGIQHRPIGNCVSTYSSLDWTLLIDSLASIAFIFEREMQPH